MDNLIIDLCFKELKIIKEDRATEGENVLFNLHKLKRDVLQHNVYLVNWYTKIEISEGTHTLLDKEDREKQVEILELENITLRDYGGRGRLQRILHRGMNKLIGEFRIPTYGGLKKYNYHDTLDALIRLVFTEDHRKVYHQRKLRIEETLNAGLELRDFDMIQ